MKSSDINLRTIYEGFYRTIGAEVKRLKEGSLYYIIVKGIKGKERQDLKIPLIAQNPFQAIASNKKKVPSIYFDVSVEDDTARYFGSNQTKYMEEYYDENGELEAIEYKKEGYPTNYSFTVTAEVRNESEGMLISNFLRRKFPLPSGRFLWENTYGKGLNSLSYSGASISRSRELFNIITPNVIVTLSFTVTGYWDFDEEIRLERPKIDVSKVNKSRK